MISQEMSMMIRHLVGEGETKAAAARRLGISRPTVYRHLKKKTDDPAPARPSKLDPYKDYIDARLKEYNLPATVLLGEIKKQGYTGGSTILREYVSRVKQKRVLDLVERYETQPGHQAQLDWGECGRVIEDGASKKLYVFVMLLGFSRMLFIRFTTSTKQHVLLECLKLGFERLGIPHRLLIDNLKQAVASHRIQEGPVFNRTFLDFCDHYGVMPQAAPPYWAQVKGKVERGVGYVKNSFLEGREFFDVPDLNQQAEAWLDTVANIRIHGTTKQRPLDRYDLEISHLVSTKVYPAYDTRPHIRRLVARDSRISYEGVRYSVDPAAVRKTVLVRPWGDRVGDSFDVYLDGQLVARHYRRPSGGPEVVLPEHQEAIKRLCRGSGGKKGQGRKGVRFCQLVEKQEITAAPAPLVQVRSLDEYEHLLLGGVR